MRTDENFFELIMQELLHQKQLLEDLEAENRELRQQLADLREGCGVFIEILGKQFSLIGDAVASSDVPLTSQSAPVVQQTSINEIEALPSSITIQLSALELQGEDKPVSTFLEELLLDEFASSATTPIAVWQGPTTPASAPAAPATPAPATAKLPTIDEDEKAALRRELVDSFLLE